MKALITDPSFSMESLEFLLNMRGEEQPGSSHARGPTLSYTKSKDKQFVSLEDCKLKWFLKYTEAT